MRVADSSRGVATSALAWASTATEWIWRRLLLTSSNMLLPAASVHGGAYIDRELHVFGGEVYSGVITGAHVRKKGKVYIDRCQGRSLCTNKQPVGSAAVLEANKQPSKLCFACRTEYVQHLVL